MQKVSIILILLTFASGPVLSQDKSMKLFLGASHCLATEGNWLPVQNTSADSLEAAYVIDVSSDPDVDHIYIVVYTNKKHSQGKVFDLCYKINAGKTTMDVQNNAGFTISRGRVVFSEPPLWGTWTQTHIASAIMQARTKATTTLSLSQISKPFPDLKCKSYVRRKD